MTVTKPEKTAAVRIGRVTLKGGADLRILRGGGDPQRARIDGLVRGALDGMGAGIVGFAFVIWGDDNGSVAIGENFDGNRIPAILVPDFVRNRLLARYDGRQFNPEPAPPAVVRERLARRLGDAEPTDRSSRLNREVDAFGTPMPHIVAFRF